VTASWRHPHGIPTATYGIMKLLAGSWRSLITSGQQYTRWLLHDGIITDLDGFRHHPDSIIAYKATDSWQHPDGSWRFLTAFSIYVYKLLSTTDNDFEMLHALLHFTTTDHVLSCSAEEYVQRTSIEVHSHADNYFPVDQYTMLIHLKYSNCTFFTSVFFPVYWFE